MSVYFRGLEYESMIFLSEGNFGRCVECGRLILKEGNNSKYCLDCSKKKQSERHIRYNGKHV